MAYEIMKVRMERKEIKRTIFELTEEKDGCDQIVFEGKKDEELKNMLLRVFEENKYFDFHISKHLGNRQCKIDMIERYSPRVGREMGDTDEGDI